MIMSRAYSPVPITCVAHAEIVSISALTAISERVVKSGFNVADKSSAFEWASFSSFIASSILSFKSPFVLILLRNVMMSTIRYCNRFGLSMLSLWYEVILRRNDFSSDKKSFSFIGLLFFKSDTTSMFTQLD